MNVAIEAAAPDVDGLARRALIVGVTAIGLCALGGMISPAQFFRSYLLAWLFWLGMALGSLGILMLQHLSGGAWGVVIRRVLESSARTLWLMALGFLPIVLGLTKLYPWALPEEVAADPILQEKSLYLNPPFFLVRAAIYFAVWGALAWAMNTWSGRQDETRDPRLARKLSMLAGPGIALYVLTMTFASVDWVMSLEPHWFSTIFGMLLVAGQTLNALSFAIAALFLLSASGPMSRMIQPRHFHDLGKLLLAFVMVWTYFAFSQFLIIWAANLPEEIPWYLRRMKGGWEWVGLALVVLQFAVPFVLLLSVRLKRDARLLSKVAVLVMVMRLVDMHWMTAPAFHPGAFSVHWMDLAAPIGVGGLWVWVFLRELKRRPLLPIGDAQLAEAIGGAHD